MKGLKDYYTQETLIREALLRAEDDPLWGETKKKANLDYHQVSFYKDRVVKKCSFDAIGIVTFGGSEGIYGSVIFDGTIDDSGERAFSTAYVFKSLSTDKDTYLALAQLSSLLAFYVMQVMGDNLSRFD